MSLSLPVSFTQPRSWWRAFSRKLAILLPKGLYARALLIVIAPMVILQCVLTYVFMERHWQRVTMRLSTVLTQEIAAIVELHQVYPGRKNDGLLVQIAQRRLDIDIEFLPKGELPPALPKPFFSIIDAALSNEIKRQIGKPFWLDTVGRSNFIEIRIALDELDLAGGCLAQRGLCLEFPDLHFLDDWDFLCADRDCDRLPRQSDQADFSLAGAAEAFGKGRDLEFHPSGAREVRQAGYAFIEMKRRIERAFEQRTTMLNGVSHDLRTILMRFKLSLALMRQTDETRDLQKDVDEMQRMLEAYLAFARGDAGESAEEIDIEEFLEDLRLDAERAGFETKISFAGDPIVTLRPDAFKRCLANLIGNAQTHAEHISIEAVRDQRFLTVHVDDDGPGIPPNRREDVFRPFFRLDGARNQDEGGTGLGLAIARDIARSHGGDISLGDSRTGGLRATVRVPV